LLTTFSIHHTSNSRWVFLSAAKRRTNDIDSHTVHQFNNLLFAEFLWQLSTRYHHTKPGLENLHLEQNSHQLLIRQSRQDAIFLHHPQETKHIFIVSPGVITLLHNQ